MLKPCGSSANLIYLIKFSVKMAIIVNNLLSSPYVENFSAARPAQMKRRSVCKSAIQWINVHSTIWFADQKRLQVPFRWSCVTSQFVNMKPVFENCNGNVVVDTLFCLVCQHISGDFGLHIERTSLRKFDSSTFSRCSMQVLHTAFKLRILSYLLYWYSIELESNIDDVNPLERLFKTASRHNVIIVSIIMWIRFIH